MVFQPSSYFKRQAKRRALGLPLPTPLDEAGTLPEATADWEPHEDDAMAGQELEPRAVTQVPLPHTMKWQEGEARWELYTNDPAFLSRQMRKFQEGLGLVPAPAPVAPPVAPVAPVATAQPPAPPHTQNLEAVSKPPTPKRQASLRRSPVVPPQPTVAPLSKPEVAVVTASEPLTRVKEEAPLTATPHPQANAPVPPSSTLEIDDPFFKQVLHSLRAEEAEAQAKHQRTEAAFGEVLGSLLDDFKAPIYSTEAATTAPKKPALSSLPSTTLPTTPAPSLEALVSQLKPLPSGTHPSTAAPVDTLAFAALRLGASKFTLPALNEALVVLGQSPANHTLLQQALAKGYFTLVPDLSGLATCIEYALTPMGKIVANKQFAATH